jgi:hypothetical protein
MASASMQATRQLHGRQGGVQYCRGIIERTYCISCTVCRGIKFIYLTKHAVLSHHGALYFSNPVILVQLNSVLHEGIACCESNPANRETVYVSG